MISRAVLFVLFGVFFLGGVPLSFAGASRHATLIESSDQVLQTYIYYRSANREFNPDGYELILQEARQAVAEEFSTTATLLSEISRRPFRNVNRAHRFRAEWENRIHILFAAANNLIRTCESLPRSPALTSLKDELFVDAYNLLSQAGSVQIEIAPRHWPPNYRGSNSLGLGHSLASIYNQLDFYQHKDDRVAREAQILSMNRFIHSVRPDLNLDVANIFQFSATFGIPENAVLIGDQRRREFADIDDSQTLREFGQHFKCNGLFYSR